MTALNSPVTSNDIIGKVNELDAREALPSQTGQGGKFLTTNGTNASWDAPLPDQTGNYGKFLKTNGTVAEWDDIPEGLPTQVGNANKILSTNGTNPYWLQKEFLRNLTAAQATQLLTDGTYNGETVATGEIFTKSDGTFQEFTDTTGTPTVDATVFASGTGMKLYATDGTTLAYTNEGNVYKSTDNGATFTQTATGVPSYSFILNMQSNPFMYLNGKWIILASNGQSAYVSTDLVSWSLVTFSFSNSIIPNTSEKVWIVYNGSNYVLGFRSSNNNNYGIFYSTDFENWTASSTALGDFQKNIHDCFAVCNGYFYSIGYINGWGVIRSADGATWEKVYTGVSREGNLYSVGNTIVVSSGTALYASYDAGSTWSVVIASNFIPFASSQKYGMAYCDGLWLVSNVEYVSANSRYEFVYKYSTDLINWTTIYTGLSSNSAYAVAYFLYVCNNKFISGAGYTVEYVVPHTYTLTDLSYNKTDVDTLVGGVLPSQTGQSGKFLTTNGATTSWDDIPTELPSQTGNTGKFLTTDGTDASWAAVPEALPNQVGNAGKALYTDGQDASWEITRDPNTYRSLSIEQETQLIVDGTYNGESATSGEIFTAEDGTFKEFTDTVTFEGITMLDYDPSSGGRYNGGCFKDWAWITMFKDSNGCFAITKDNGLTWSQTTPSGTFPGPNSYTGYGLTDDTTLYLMAGGFNGTYGQKTTDGINFTQFICPANTPNQYYIQYGYCGGKFIVNKYYYGNDTYGTRGYVYSDDPSVSWTVGAYPTGVTSALMMIFSDSVYLIDEDTKRVYKTLPGEGFLTTWTDTGYNSDTTRSLTYTPNIDGLYVVNDIAFWMGNRNLEYSLDNGITWTQTSYSIKGVFYCKDTQTYIGLNNSTPTVYYTSTDGINWQQETVEAGKSIYTGCWTYNGNCVITLSNSASSRINTIPSHHFAVDSLSYSKEELDELVLPPLADDGAPVDDITEGTLGKIYIDTTNKDAYICVEADSSIPTYTWKKITP